MLKKLTKRDCNISISIYADDTPIRGNAIVSGDDKMDKEVEDELISRLNDEDIWAWCVVTVTAEYNGYTGKDHLGACSYKNEEDFKTPGGYYDDMVENAIDELNDNIAKAVSKSFMTNDQKTALCLLLKRYGEAVYETSAVPGAMYNEFFRQEQLAEKEVLDFVDAMLASASKEGASTVLDKSLWNA